MRTVFGSNPFFGRAFGGAGSAAAPSYSFFGEPTTGIYKLGSGRIGFVCLSADAFSIRHSASTTTIDYPATGANIVFNSTGGMIFNAAGTNQILALIPSGSGATYFGSGDAYARMYALSGKSFAIGTSDHGTAIYIDNAASLNLLIGTGTNSGNGKIQLATHTTSAGGIGFGTDCTLYRSAANTLAIGGASLDIIGGALTAAGRIVSYGATFGIGYATGAGGTVTQITNKATGVTLNKVCGQITMNAAALAAATTVDFILTNSAIAQGDVLIINHFTGGTRGSYTFNASTSAGQATISVRNVSAGSLSEAIVLAYAVIKTVTA